MVGMLACARIGAPHTVVFGGFSAERHCAIASIDCGAKVVLTQDGALRHRSNVVPSRSPSTAL